MNLPLISEGIQIAGSGVQTAGSIVDFIDKIQAKKLSHQNCLRACYLETINKRDLQNSSFASPTAKKRSFVGHRPKNCKSLCKSNRLLQEAHNISLIDAIDQTALAKAEVFTPAFTAVVNARETQCTALILFAGEDEKAANTFGLVKKQGKIPQDGFSEKTRKNIQKWKYENIVDAMFAIVAGINVLQKLSAAPPETKDIIRSLQLHTRVKNIKDRLLIVKKTLKDMI